MEDKKLSEKESLELIAQMIQNTRERVEKNAGKPFIVGGYATIVVALVIWFLITKTGRYEWHWLWFLLPAMGFSIRLFSGLREKHVTTYVDRVVSNIWQILGTAVVLVSIVAFQVYIPIFFIVLLLISAAVALTGCVIQFRMAVFSGLLGILASFTFLYIHGNSQILLFAAVFFIMMVIPGHLLNAKTKKKSCSKS